MYKKYKSDKSMFKKYKEKSKDYPLVDHEFNFEYEISFYKNPNL